MQDPCNPAVRLKPRPRTRPDGELRGERPRRGSASSLWSWGLRVGLAAAALTACSTPTYVFQRYDGPPRVREELSVFRFRGEAAARLVALDGERVPMALSEDTRAHVEVLPGPHELQVGNAVDPLRRVQVVSLSVDAGRVYRVTVEAAPGVGAAYTPEAPWETKVYEVDAESDAILGEVPLRSR